jgi:hypothetical protein
MRNRPLNQPRNSSNSQSPRRNSRINRGSLNNSNQHSQESVHQPSSSSSSSDHNNRPVTRSRSKTLQSTSNNEQQADYESTSSYPFLAAQRSMSNSSLESMDTSTSYPTTQSSNELFVETHNNFQNRINETSKSIQKILINEKKCNIIKIIEDSKMTGKAPKNFSNVNHFFSLLRNKIREIMIS